MDKLRLFEFFLDKKSVGIIWLSLADAKMWFEGDKEKTEEFYNRYKGDFAVISMYAPESDKHKPRELSPLEEDNIARGHSNPAYLKGLKEK